MLLLVGVVACGDGAGATAGDEPIEDGPEPEQAFALVSTSGVGLPVPAPVCVDERGSWECPDFTFLDCDALPLDARSSS